MKLFSSFTSSPLLRVKYSYLTSIGDSSHNLETDWKLCADDVYIVIDRFIRKRDPNKVLS